MIDTPWGLYPDAQSAVLAPYAYSLAPGDVVVLTSGGQRMTVEDVCEECGDVSVVWFEGTDVEGCWVGPLRDVFDADMLVQYGPSPNDTVH